MGKLSIQTFVGIGAIFSLLSAQAQFQPINFMGANADPSGVKITANYNGNCPATSMKADLWLSTNGQPEFQNRCYINPAWNVNANNQLSLTNQGFCYFRRPQASGQSATNAFVRLWKVSADCSSYADALSPISANSYEDHSVQGQIAASPSFDAFNQGRLISIVKPWYQMKVDRNGGATYEFYGSRASRDGLSFMANAIHSHNGAALQIAIHDQGPNRVLTTASCDPTQGYWNPTQAGASCGYQGGQITGPASPQAGVASSSLQVSCDGASNNQCVQAANSVEHGIHAMMNWDYGAGYEGPYNSSDLTRLYQKINATDSYVEFSNSFINLGIQRKGFIEIPTFYFKNDFRKYFYRESPGSPLQTIDIPVRTGNIPLPSVWQYKDLRWMGFEDTWATNDPITIAWFYSPEFKLDITDSGYAFKVDETDFFRAIKFTNAPTFLIRQNKWYGFKYVIFPFRYNEVINTPLYGTDTVEGIIQKMRLQFEGA